MRSTFASPLSLLSPAPVARLAAAVAASALAHWVLLTSLLPDAPWRTGVIRTGPASITVRIAPLPAPVPREPVSPDPEPHRAPEPVATAPGSVARLQSAQERGPARSSASAPQTSSERIDPDSVFRGPDPNYYAARDLDGFPRPLTPLRIDYPPGSAAGEIRFEILIDEHGVVRDINFQGSAELGSTHESLRGTLMATLFIPAIKDGRAVKSRIVLSVGFPSTSER
jgi:protein TonB